MASLLQTRRQALAVAAAVVLALVLVGRLLVHAGTPSAAPPPRAIPVARPSGAAAPAVGAVSVVDVVGAVRRPGLYRLRQGSRIADAVARAGGATAKADLMLVNLAAPVADGQQIVVPARGAAGAAAVAAGAGGGAAASTGPVDLNTATAEQLDALPGVGPVTAQKIIDYRTQHGAFRSVDELDAIPGIGPRRLEQLRPLVAP